MNKIIKKIAIIIVGIYFLLGFIMGVYFYVQELKVFECVYPDTSKNMGMGGFFTNTDPEHCTRRGFTLRALSIIPFLTVAGVPLATAKYYYGNY